MNDSRKRELADRLQANGQRRAREAFLAELPPDLNARFSRAECVFSPEFDTVLRRVLPFDEDRVGTTSQSALPDFRFLRTGWPDEVRRAIVTAAGPELDSALLVVGDVHTVEFRGRIECVSELPLFRMPWGEAIGALSALWQPSLGFRGAFTEDLSAGVLVASFCEYPESGPVHPTLGPEECTYDLVRWGT